MKVFCDASAMAKRFIEHEASSTVDAYCAQADELGVSVICLPEVVSALCRLRRENRLTSTQYQQARAAVLDEFSDMTVTTLSEDVLAISVRLLESYALRAMDALHLAAAIAWGADHFLSGDRQQLQAAASEGLKTVAV